MRIRGCYIFGYSGTRHLTPIFRCCHRRSKWGISWNF